MPSNDVFFNDQTEQSAIKARIVSSYFTAWARVMRNNWTSKMGYIDLFCGPGKYEDDTPSAPLQIIQSTLYDPVLEQRMFFVFNDEDPHNIATLKHAISKIDSKSALAGRIQYLTETIESNFYSRIFIPNNIPVLSFVDPFGYKGLTIKLINQLISNNGSDCIFFFNYNRINMALSSNTKFDEHLKNLFGAERTAVLKDRLSLLHPAQREPVILNGLVEALKENKGNYVLPFKFYSNEILRTSHFIIFVTKHPTACAIMKQIMYSNSAKDSDGVATFSFEDSNNFTEGLEQLTLFTRPIQSLREEILHEYKGKRIRVKDICNKVDCDFDSHFVGKNVKDVLKQFEIEERIEIISGRKQKIREGRLTMPDGALIEFK